MKGRQRDKQHLRFIATCRCIKCGDDSATSDREAAHYRSADARIGKPITGVAIKPDDKYVLPLCTSCHREGPRAQHKIGEYAFWHHGDPVLWSLALYAVSGDINAVLEKIARHSIHAAFQIGIVVGLLYCIAPNAFH